MAFFTFISLIFYALIILYILYLIITMRCYRFWSNLNIDQVRAGPPFGNLSDFIFGKHNFGQLIHKIYKKSNKTYVGFYMGLSPALLVRDASMAQTILRTDFEYFNTRQLYSREEPCPLLNNVYNKSGQRWFDTRKILEPAFTDTHLRPMLPMILRAVTPVSEYLDAFCNYNMAYVNVHNLMEKFLFDVMGSALYGISLNSFANPHEKLRTHIHRTLEPTYKSKIRFFRYFVMPKWMKSICNVRMLDQKTEHFFLSLVKHTLLRRDIPLREKNDYVHLLARLRKFDKFFKPPKERLNFPNVCDDYDKTVSVQELSTHALMALLGGYDSMLKTLCFALYELACNPRFQERIHLQMKQDNISDNFSFEQLKEMQWIDYVLKETMRKYPPKATLRRYCTKPYTLPHTNVTLQVGTPVLISILGMHHDVKYFSRPLEFDPDRFDIGLLPNGYFPYGYGNRDCLGKNMASLIMRAMLASILFKYTVDLKVTKKNMIVFGGHSYLQQAENIRLNFTRR